MYIEAIVLILLDSEKDEYFSSSHVLCSCSFINWRIAILSATVGGLRMRNGEGSASAKTRFKRIYTF